jgi:hypothetical protein
MRQRVSLSRLDLPPAFMHFGRRKVEQRRFDFFFPPKKKIRKVQLSRRANVAPPRHGVDLASAHWLMVLDYDGTVAMHHGDMAMLDSFVSLWLT